MKNFLFSTLFFLIFSTGFAQTYNPANFTVSNKSYGVAQDVSTDARSLFYDATLFKMRPYQSTAEVLSYLNLAKYRSGYFPIWVNVGGTLTGSTFTGGSLIEYWFRNGTSNSDLVIKSPGTSGTDTTNLHYQDSVNAARIVAAVSKQLADSATLAGRVNTEASARIAADANKADKTSTVTFNGNIQTLGNNPSFTVALGVTDTSNLHFQDSIHAANIAANRAKEIADSGTIRGAVNSEATLRGSSDITTAAFSGTTTKTLVLTKGDATTLSASFTDLTGGGGSGNYPSADSLKVLQIRTTKYFNTYNGSDANNGLTTDLPKLTLATDLAASSSGQVFKLSHGSTFREKLLLQGTGKRNFTFEGYDLGISGKLAMPIWTSADIVNTGWSLLSGTSNTYFQLFTNNANNPLGAGYNFIVPVAVDIALEKISPTTAYKALDLATSLSNVETTPGTFWNGAAISGALDTVYIHLPSSTPGAGVFRVEIPTRTSVIYAQNQTQTGNAKSIKISDVSIRSSGQNGYGAALADSTFLDKVTFQNYPVHAAVIYNNSVINKVAFLGTGKGVEQGCVAFYTTAGSGGYYVAKNSIGLDIGQFSLSHTSGGSNHAKITYFNNFAWTDTVRTANFYASANTDTISIDHNYFSKGYGIYAGDASIMNFSNSIADSITGIAFIGNTGTGKVWNITNSFFKTASGGAIYTGANTAFTASYSIVHLNGSGLTVPTIQRSIIIADNPNVSGVQAISPQTSGCDYNLYVQVNGSGLFNWTNSGTQTSFATYQGGGNEPHSKLIVVDNLRQLFVSPETGNYTLVQGGFGDSARLISAGMVTPVKYIRGRPTKEEVVEWIREDKVPFVSDMLQGQTGAGLQNVTALGNKVNVASGIVMLNSSGLFPAADGSLITNVVPNLVSTTAATVGVNKRSPFLAFGAEGYATTPANSQPTRFRLSDSSVQGTTNPTALFVLESSINNATYGNALTYSSAGILTAPTVSTTNATITTLTGTNATSTTMTTSNGNINGLANIVRFAIGATPTVGLQVINSQAATNAARIQLAPTISQYGFAWDGTVSQQTIFNTDVTPVFASSQFGYYTIKSGSNNRFTISTSGSVGINTATPNGVAALDISSTTQGLLPPRGTTAQRDLLVGLASASINTVGSSQAAGTYNVVLSGATTGSGALVTAVVAGGIATGVTILNSGTGYSGTLTGTIVSGGTPATFTFTLGTPEGLRFYNLTTHQSEEWNGTSWVH